METIIGHKIRLILPKTLSPKILEHVWVDEKLFFSTMTKFAYLGSKLQLLLPKFIKHFFWVLRNVNLTPELSQDISWVVSQNL